MLKFTVVTALAYSKLVSNTFSVGECICLHQWKNLGVKPSVILKTKFNEVVKQINAQNWERPVLHYDESMQLYYQCPETSNWIKVTNN